MAASVNKKQSKTALRQALRSNRTRLTAQEQLHASRNLGTLAQRCYRLCTAQYVLSYAPFNGEISPNKIPLSNSVNLYLPRITNYTNKSMHFYQAGKTQTNQFGISEPSPINGSLPANAFQVILLPLVAFDRHGSRVGVGAGFYDRALQSLAHQPSTRPYLLGLAHHFQEVKSIPQAPWDVTLDAILTDREFIKVT